MIIVSLKKLILFLIDVTGATPILFSMKLADQQKTWWQLHDGYQVAVKEDQNDQTLYAKILDEKGTKIADLALPKNSDLGNVTVTNDVFKEIKKNWFYSSPTYTISKSDCSAYVASWLEQCWDFTNPIGGNFSFFKVMQKHLDALDNNNPYKNNLTWAGKYLPRSIFINNLGPFEWDSKDAPAPDHQPAPPWIEVSVRTFAEILWPQAHGQVPEKPITRVSNKKSNNQLKDRLKSLKKSLTTLQEKTLLLKTSLNTLKQSLGTH